MPPKTESNRTTTAGPAAPASVVRPDLLRGPRPIDEIAELLLAALNNATPTRAPFVYRVVKRGSELHGEEVGIRASSRAEADKLAAERAERWECELRFVREQRASEQSKTRTP